MQLVGCSSSIHGGTAPSGNDSGDTATGSGRGKWDRGNRGTERDGGLSLDSRHVVGNGLRVVAGVVSDLGAHVRNSTGVQGSGSDNNADGGCATSNGAMGSRKHPTAVDDGSSAEMEVRGGTEGDLERSGGDGNTASSDDSSFTSEELVDWTCQCDGHEG